MSKKIIRKSALILIRDRKILVTRSYGESIYLSPGGKPEGNETDEQALVREIREELNAEIDFSKLELYGKYEDAAANDPEATIYLTLFRGEVIGDIKPSGEIEELKWVDSSFNQNSLASLIRKRIIPDLVKEGLMD